MKPMLTETTAQVWFAPTARRRYFTKRAASIAEARARIKKKYPPERPECDENGRYATEGWYWGDLPNADALLARYARKIMAATSDNPPANRETNNL